MTPLPRLRSNWQISFADVLSQLLCLLVLAYSLKVQAPARSETSLAAIRGLFGGPPVTANVALPVRPPRATADYWTTWLQTRLADAPALAGVRATSESGAARLALDPAVRENPAALRQLAEILDRSERRIVIVASQSDSDPRAWSQGGTAAVQLAHRLAEAGLATKVALVLESGSDGIFIDVEEDGA